MSLRLRFAERVICPGVWVELEGPRVFCQWREVLAYFEWPDTPDHRAAVRSLIRRATAKEYPGVVIEERE